MGLRYYDEAVYNLIKSWVKNSKMRVLRPDETSDLFKINADLNEDKPLSLPLIALSRNTNIEILNTKKNLLSFSGKRIGGNEEESIQLNAIPITLGYQIDIYTKKFAEADEYVREFVFGLINNPSIKITLPYNGLGIDVVANIRLESTISDNSDIPERLFRDQFTRFTIQFELLDAYLYSIPFNPNATIESAYISDTTSNSELDVMNSDGTRLDMKENL